MDYTRAYVKLFVEIMEKLSLSNNLYDPIPEILKQVCLFFRFGCSFVYELDRDEQFVLTESFSLYQDNGLRERVSIGGLLRPEQLESILKERSLIIFGDDEDTELTKTLKEMFQANLLVLVPITDNHENPLGFIGFSDRRKGTVLTMEDFDVVASILAVLANQVKLYIYQTRVENTYKALDSTVNNMGIDIYVNDYYTHEILYVNKSMAEPYGGAENMVGKVCWQALYDEQPKQCAFCPREKLLDEKGEPSKIYSWDYQRPMDDKWFRVFSAAFEWVDGRLAHVITSVDITENKQNEAVIQRMADYDTLTGLPNRRKLIDDIEKSMCETKEKGKQGFVLFFDLDDFKHVNDQYGHRAGDDLLHAIAQLLEALPLTAGHTYRYGGDEFVLLYEMSTPSEVEEIIKFVRKELSRPFELRDGTIALQASIGISCFPADVADAEELIHRADLAMYHAKLRKKGDVGVFEDQKTKTLSEWLESRA